jgi:hypothetical protein
MVFISALIPAPELGSKPAMVSTTGGLGGIVEMYRKAYSLQIRFVMLVLRIANLGNGDAIPPK